VKRHFGEKPLHRFFVNKEVSYLGFTLTPEGKNKLKAIKDVKLLTDVKTIQSFIGLCNIFQTHINNFAIIAAPLFRLTRKDSGYKGGSLPKDTMDAFCTLQNSLMSEPIMAFPQANQQYALITDAGTGTTDTAGGLGAILTQKDNFDNYYAISYAFHQLKDPQKTILLSFWNPPLKCGEWMSLMNTLKEKKSSYSQTTNL
jgi:hypothetical protein